MAVKEYKTPKDSQPLERTDNEKLYDTLASIAVKQIQAALAFKKNRMADIEKNVESYINKTRPALTGRFNIPLPTMAGMVDTVLSKIDDAPKLVFKAIREQDIKKAEKLSAQWEVDMASGRWASKDRLTKKLAILSGRAIFKIYAESNPEYKSHLDIVHYKDFLCEPQGGSYLEDHLFAGQINIFKSKYDLEQGVKDGVYDKAQVNRLTSGATATDYKRSSDAYISSLESFKALGLDEKTNNYVGEDLFNLTEWSMEYHGVRYYLLLDYHSGLWVRCSRLDDVFGCNLYPWVSWATHEDPLNFWSKSYADDFRALSETTRILLNQELDNRQKRNWGQKLVDPMMVEDMNLLEYRPDGIVPVNTKGRPIDNAVKILETPELRGTLELLTWLSDFWGTQTGVTASAQGASDVNAKVAVYFGDLQQIADRFGLLNKNYDEAWRELGIRYDWGLYENMDEGMMVKVLGIKGVEWSDLTKDDVEPDFDLSIVGGNAEAQLDEIKRKTKIEAINIILARPELTAQVGQKWLISEILVNGGFDNEQVKVALDRENEGNQEILSEAAQAIQDILSGKQPEPNRGANTAFVQKILDFAYDNKVDESVFNNLLAYAQAHINIALSNAVRKAQSLLARQGLGLPNLSPANPADPSNPQGGMMNASSPNNPAMPPNSPAGVASTSQTISHTLRP